MDPNEGDEAKKTINPTVTRISRDPFIYNCGSRNIRKVPKGSRKQERLKGDKKKPGKNWMKVNI
jgi:hypothetical protein